MADRAELERWIADTRRTQKRLGLIVAILAVIATGLFAWNRTAGGFAWIVVTIVGGLGYWVTASHISDWTARIDEPETRFGKPITRRERD